MEQGYKHFSHPHNLLMHHMPEGVEVSCSGCNSAGNSTVYVCWQCNFFLHEQCYRATRSLKHPSHPAHPLTLIPYPTYPSNSFYCNSCEIIGTGFSYSCSDCDFDLHVQCAYSISRATSFQKTHHYPTTNYYNLDHQEPVPSAGWIGQNPNMAYNSLPNPHSAAQNPYMTPNAHSVSVPNSITSAPYHSTGQDLAYVSIPPVRQNSFTIAHQDPATAQNGPSISVPINSQYPISNSQYPSMAQTGPPVSIPADSQNPITNAQYSLMAQAGPSASVPTTTPPNPVTSTQHPSMPPNAPSASSIPANSHNPSTSVQYPSLSQYVASVSVPSKNQGVTNQSSNMAQNGASISIPATSPYNQPENHVESAAQIQMKDKGVVHFGHPHNLVMVTLQQEENEIACSGCEEDIVGKGYSCVEPNCSFHLHDSCFHLKREIQHKSHPQHTLTLLSLAPYNNKNGEFTCNACFSDGTGFTYHCSICKFDLHIQCVSLPETMKRKDHEHTLKLFYSCPVQGEEHRVSCDVCHGVIQKDRWLYFCESCDYATHLGCVDCEECEGDISVLDAQVQLQRLQLQMEMARQQAQMIASMGSSLASLV